MPLTLARVRRPASLDELDARDRAALPIVAQLLWGEEMALDEIWEMDDFGADLRVWEIEDAGEVRYQLWDDTGGMDAVLIDREGPRAAGASVVQHDLQNWEMEPTRFAELEAAWTSRGVLDEHEV